MATAYVALGSNLGDRQGHLDRALEALSADHDLRVLRTSASIETAPVGGPRQPNYINAAVAIETDLAAPDLLARLLDIEQRLGRVRAERWGSRVIDLDLLLYDDLVCDLPNLTLPHPRLHLRRFVLEPLAEIAPDAMHPVLKRTVSELLVELTAG